MPIDREGTLSKADKLLRQGRLDLAIAEYERLVEDQPQDWNTANTLGDVYLRDGQTDRAVSVYHGIADHLLAEGFAPKAAAVFKKVLKIAPGDEKSHLQLAQISTRQGLLAEARAYLNAVLARRQATGDTAGADAGQDRHTTLLAVRLELDIREGRVSDVRKVVNELLALDLKSRERVLTLARTFADASLEAASAAVETVADVVASTGDLKGAIAILRSFTQAAPGRTSALLKLVEVCVDGGFETDTYDAQAQLAAAYLSAGRVEEARMIFEDLLAREPWDGGHMEGLRRSLVLLSVADPEAVISRIVNSTAEEHVEAPDAGDPLSPPAEPTPPPPARPAPSESPMEIDLTNILTDLRDLELPPAPPPPPQDLDRVFATMRDQAERAHDDDEAGEYLGLARSYVEMGLTAEAVAALEDAVKSPAVRFEAATMLGKLANQRGDVLAAIDWFERAAEVPASSVDEGRALLYELGATLERAGETARALAIFLELQSEAGDYRDLVRRIATLSRSQAGD